MSTVGWTAFAVTVFLANLAAHEAAHAVALQGLGGRIKAGGLGLPFWPCLRLRPRGRRDWTLTLSPWLLGAYVEPDDDSVELVKTLPYRDQAWFSAAGVIVNLVIGCGLVAAAGAVAGRVDTVVIFAVAAVGLWLVRRLVASYVVPVIGLLAIVLIVVSFVTTPVTEAQGVVGTVQFLEASTLLEALRVSAAISLGLGLVNCLPFYPFDGGRVVGDAVTHLFGERVADVFKTVTVFCSLGIIAYALTTDALSVMS